MQETISTDWRAGITKTAETLKLEDGDTVDFTFLNEGEEKSHPDFGNSVKFTVKVKDAEKAWYVNSRNFDLLAQIKDLGVLTNLTVKLSRKGSKKSDTRYFISKL